MMTREELLKIVKASFLDSASQAGLDGREFVRLSAIESNEMHDGMKINDSNQPYPNVNSSEISIDDFIKKAYDISSQITYSLIDDMCLFCHDNYDFLSDAIDWEKLKFRSKSKGIDVTKEDWMKQYLVDIPIIEIYGYDLNAFVRYYNQFEDCILISNTIGAFFRAIIANLIVAYLFPLHELHSSEMGSNIVMRRSNEEPYDKYSMAKCLFAVCQHLANPSAKNLANLGFRHTYILNNKINILFSILLYKGAFEFSVLHEISHIVQSHILSTQKISDEINADILAHNVNLWSGRNFYNSYNLNELNARYDNIFYIMKAIGPIVLMNTFLLIMAIQGNDNSSSHPHPKLRRMFLEAVSSLKIQGSENSSYLIAKTIEWVNELFSTACQLNNLQDFFVKEGNDLSANIPAGEQIYLYYI